MEEDIKVLNYRGLAHLVERLKTFFIKNPKQKAAGKYLRCIDSNGNVEWAEFPTLLTFKGTVASYSQLPTTDNSPGDVWKVESTGAEYVWILNSAGTSYIWEYMGQLVNLTTHAGITDTATAGQVLVSKSNGAEGITYEWVTLTNSDTTYSFSQSGNTLTITPSSGSASTSYTPTFTDTDEKQKIDELDSGIMYLTGVTTAPTSTEVAYKGKAHSEIKALSTGTLYSNQIGNAVTQSTSGNIKVTYESTKYITRTYSNLSANTNCSVVVTLPETTYTVTGAKEVIVRIVNGDSTYSVNVLIEKLAAISLTNMYNANITISGVGVTIPANKTMELVFTFWTDDDVTFNGGISV